MIERSYVWIDGPKGVGKTTLIERLLESNRTRSFLAARFEESAAVRKATEVRGGNQETARYGEAGARAAALYRHPPPERLPLDMHFWTTRFMEEYSHAILFDGQRHPEVHPDLSVCVMRPLEKGERLFFKGKVDAALLDLPTGIEMERIGALWPPDKAVRRWQLARKYAAVGQAAVVVINLHDEGERAAADTLRAEIARLRRDPKIRREVLGWWGSRRPISVFTVNLEDRTDAELKKALARIKRALAGPDLLWRDVRR